MSLFIESICLKNREIRNLEYHQKRMVETRRHFFGLKDDLNFENLIKVQLPASNDKFKCRIVYGKEIEALEIIPYQIRPVQSFHLIKNEEISYPFKFEDRAVFAQLKTNLSEDDEIIIVKNGYITDTSYSNLIFYDGQTWVTPSTPLLNGTMRQYLLATQQICETDITPENLNQFSSFKMINAMMGLDEGMEFGRERIIF